MGKRLNLIQRGSYERRVHLSGLRHNKSFSWHCSPYKRVTGSTPGRHFKEYMSKKHKQSRQKKKNCKTLFSNRPLTKIKNKEKPEKNIHYGPNAEQVEEDPTIISSESEIFTNRLQVTLEERNIIENNTVGQFHNSFYQQERNFRLTPSLFGRVIKRRPQTSCHNIVKSCLQDNSIHTDAIDYGIAKEIVALKHFENHTNLRTRSSGLWVDLEYGFLGASPDGIVEDDSILEIKCIYFKPHDQVNSLQQAINHRKSLFCLEKKNNEIRLKKNHSYYYQIQGQLHITNKRKCYFVVYINDEIDLYVEEIFRDDEFWENKMVNELVRFYKECIAPEIIRENLKRGKICVDPPYILQAITEFSKRKQQKSAKPNNKKT